MRRALQNRQSARDFRDEWGEQESLTAVRTAGTSKT
jgi:hypothetical protein